MRLGRERPRKGRHPAAPAAATAASMRLGRERPRKPPASSPPSWAPSRFNEAGARTPQKVNGQTFWLAHSSTLQ